MKTPTKTYAVVNVVDNSVTDIVVFDDFLKAVDCAMQMIHEQVIDAQDEAIDLELFMKDSRDRMVRYFNFNTCYTVDDETTVNIITVK